MRTYLVSFQLLVDEVDALGVTAIIFEYMPLLFTWAAFTLLFIAVPNCKVTTRYAVIGGLVTAICFELAKVAFGTVIAHSSYTTVYGAFAIFSYFPDLGLPNVDPSIGRCRTHPFHGNLQNFMARL